jgi:hypothetical protein
LFTVDPQFYTTNCLTLTVHLTEALKHWKINTDPKKDFKIPAHVSEYLTCISVKIILKSVLPIPNYYQRTAIVLFSLCSCASQTILKLTALPNCLTPDGLFSSHKPLTISSFEFNLNT